MFSALDASHDDIDFRNNPQKYFELYSMNSDGSDIMRITNNLFLRFSLTFLLMEKKFSAAFIIILDV